MAGSKEKKTVSTAQWTFQAYVNSRCRSSSCLFAVLAMFLAIISPSSYSWNDWNVRHFCFHSLKTTQPLPQVISVNGALTCTFDVIGSLIAKFFQISGYQLLVMVNYACAFSQSESGKYFEWLITIDNNYWIRLSHHTKNLEGVIRRSP